MVSSEDLTRLAERVGAVGADLTLALHEHPDCDAWVVRRIAAGVEDVAASASAIAHEFALDLEAEKDWRRYSRGEGGSASKEQREKMMAEWADKHEFGRRLQMPPLVTKAHFMFLRGLIDSLYVGWLAITPGQTPGPKGSASKA